MTTTTRTRQGRVGEASVWLLCTAGPAVAIAMVERLAPPGGHLGRPVELARSHSTGRGDDRPRSGGGTAGGGLGTAEHHGHRPGDAQWPCPDDGGGLPVRSPGGAAPRPGDGDAGGGGDPCRHPCSRPGDGHRTRSDAPVLGGGVGGGRARPAAAALSHHRPWRRRAPSRRRRGRRRLPRRMRRPTPGPCRSPRSSSPRAARWPRSTPPPPPERSAQRRTPWWPAIICGPSPARGSPRCARQTPDEGEHARYWVRLVDANRGRIRSGDPDLIFPAR